MSYDIYFVKRHPDQTWDEALEARDESDDDSPLADLSPAPGTTILSTISTDLHGPN